MLAPQDADEVPLLVEAAPPEVVFADGTAVCRRGSLRVVGPMLRHQVVGDQQRPTPLVETSAELELLEPVEERRVGAADIQQRSHPVDGQVAAMEVVDLLEPCLTADCRDGSTPSPEPTTAQADAGHTAIRSNRGFELSAQGLQLPRVHRWVVVVEVHDQVVRVEAVRQLVEAEVERSSRAEVRSGVDVADRWPRALRSGEPGTQLLVPAVVDHKHEVRLAALFTQPVEVLQHGGRTPMRAQDAGQTPPAVGRALRPDSPIHAGQRSRANSLRRVRLLFVSGTTIGGSGRSQRELAARLGRRGHEVLFLVDLEHPDRTRRWLYEQLSDLSVRWEDRSGGELVRLLERIPGRRVAEVSIDGLPHLASPIPENAFPRLCERFRPDVVIGSSVLRLTWRKVAEHSREHGVPTVLYVREEEALNHFHPPRGPADATVANAAALAARVEALGVSCPVFPSVVEVDVTKVASSRRVALTINPVESRGIRTIWELAAQLPEVPFVVQESWPLGPGELASVERHAGLLPNVEFRRAEPPGPRLYRDARVLLVPYEVDNRPRVIAEAQANGIPVIAADSPALVEATGHGGVVVASEDLDAWRDSVRSMFEDAEGYEDLCRRAFEHSRRQDMSAAGVAQGFEAFLERLVARRRQPSDPGRAHR